MSVASEHSQLATSIGALTALPPMTLKNFAERTIRVDKKTPFRLTDRPYLVAPYTTDSDKIILRASRQTEKSTFLVNCILYRCFKQPDFRVLFVSPRREQARLFSKTRLAGTVRDSTILRRILYPHQRALPPVDIEFANGSQVHIRSAFLNADAVRGISADLLVVDEFQDLAAGELPVLEETTSHARRGRLLLAGTPKLIDNHLEASFADSTAREWQVPCTTCSKLHVLDERVLGPTDLICPDCQAPLEMGAGRWVARNPNSTWGEGYWINHLLVPWMHVPQIVARQQTYDSVRFRNEVLGLPVTLGDHLITRQQIEACCDPRPFAQRLDDVPPAARPRLVAGIDWGGGAFSATLLVLGYIERQRVFRVIRMDRWMPYTDQTQLKKEIVELCLRFRVRHIAADGCGFGRIFNRELFGSLRGSGPPPIFHSIIYTASNKDPERDGVLFKWNVDRSDSIGTMFSRIRMGLLRFPQVSESSSFLDEFTCEVAVYDAYSRSHQYTKPDTHRDDALHATNYAELVGLRMPESAIA